MVRYLADAVSVNATQHKDAAALDGQRLDDRLEMAQLVPGMKARLQPVVDLQHVEVRHQVERDNFVAARDVDQQIAGDLEQVSATRGDAREIGGDIGARQGLGSDVLGFVRVG